MVKRRQIQDLEVSSVAAPQARPVDTFYRPNTAGLSLVQDFAGLSKSITDFLQDKAERDKEKGLAEGRAFAVENPELSAQWQAAATKDDPKANRKAFRKLVEDGKIKQLESPWAEVGWQEASARQLMATYRSSVAARIAETAAIVGPDGQPQEPPSIEQIMAEEYEKVSANPVLQTTYGRNAAVAVKEEFDNQARVASAEARLDAKDANYRSTLTKEMAEQLDQVGMADEVTIRGLNDFVQSAMTEKTVKDPRGLVVDALRMSVSRTRRNEGGADHALQLLRSAENIRVEGLFLKDDPRSSSEIEQLRASLLDQQERQAGKDNRARAEAEQKVVGEYRGKWITRFEAAQRNGEDLGAIYEEELATVESGVGDPDMRGIVIQELKNTVETVEGTDISTPSAVDDVLRLIALGDVEGANAAYAAKIADPAVRFTTKDLFSLRQALDGAEALDPWIEKNPVRNDALGRILELEDEFSQFGGEADTDWRRMIRDERDAFNLQMEQLASLPDSPGKSKAIRDGVNAWMKEFGTRTDEERTKRFEGRTEFYDKLESLNTHKQDAREFAARARDQGIISIQEYRQAVDLNDQAADRTPLLRSDAVQAAKDNIYRSVFDSKNPMVSSERVADAWGALDAKVHAWADANLAKTDAREINRALAAAVPDLVDEVLGTTPEAAKAEETTEAGGTAEEAAEAANVEQARVGEARGLFDAVTSPKKMRGDDPLLRRSELVPRSTYDAYARFAQKTGDVSKDDVTSLFARQSFEVLDDASLTPQQREEAVVSMFRLTGIPAEQVLAGKITVELPKGSPSYQDGKTRLEAARLAQRVPATRVLRPFENARLQGVVDFWEKTLDRTDEVPLTDLSRINPYSTPLFTSKQEIESWKRNRPEELNALREKLGIADDPQAVKFWLDSQVEAMIINARELQ